jgi:hypothetical protein
MDDSSWSNTGEDDVALSAVDCKRRANWDMIENRTDKPGISLFRRRWRLARRAYADRPNLVPAIA